MTEAETVVIGAGQAGLATSWWLTRRGCHHVVLERRRIGNAWRTQRWDSFCLVTPNWMTRLPGAEYDGDEPDLFESRDAFVDRLEAWARSFDCPVREAVEVIRLAGAGAAFRLETTAGEMVAKNVVVATSTYQSPRIPDVAAAVPARIRQETASSYRNPAGLPSGAVLVVGSGQSGCQIAEELNERGRRTYLSVGRAGRLPRRYRGRDLLSWQHAMGYLDRTPDMLERPEHRFRADPHLSGKNGGHVISLHNLHRDGVTLLGGLRGFHGKRALFADDLQTNVRFADDFAADLRKRIDAHIVSANVFAPEAVAAELDGEPTPGWSLPRIDSLDLAEHDVSTIIWATGFRFDFSWIKFPLFDPSGYPVTRGSATDVPGLYFMGLNWMRKRQSGIIFGVGEDAELCTALISERT